MGFLEEAIREHLDLQRRRGGDPRQIAIAEREALEPLVPGQTPEWAEGPALFDHEQPAQAQPAPSGRPLIEPGQVTPQADDPFAARPDEQFVAHAGDHFAEPPAQGEALRVPDPAFGVAAPGPALSGLDQETAELDMSAVLGLAEEAGEPQLGRLGGDAGIPEFGPVRAERIVPDPAAPIEVSEDFEWEIPGVTRSPGS